MSNSQVSDEDYFREKLEAVVRPDIISAVYDQGLQIVVQVPSGVTRDQFDNIFRKEANLCASRSFAGFDEQNEFTRSAKAFEGVFNLQEDPDKFVDFLYNKVVPDGKEELDLNDFLLGVEIFDTAVDQYWSNPVILVSIHPVTLNACRLLSKFNEIKGKTKWAF